MEYSLQKKKPRLYYKWLWTSIVSTPRLIGKSLIIFRSKHIHHADDNDKWYMYMYPWYGFFQPHLFFDNSTTILNTLNKNTYRTLSLFLINFTPKLNVFLQNIYPRQKYSVFLIISSILFKYAYLEYLIYNYKRFFFQYSTSPDTSVVLIPSIPLKKNKERIKALSWSRIIISKFCFHQQKHSKNLFSLEQVSWNSSWLVYSFNLL